MKNIIICLSVLFALVSCNNDQSKKNIVINEAPPSVYYGGNIITMEGEIPAYVEAVVVDGETISFAGTKSEALELAGKGAEMIDLKGSTLLPGFIDPHLHPSLAAGILSVEIVSAMEWTVPTGKIKAVVGRDNFLTRINELHTSYTDPKKVLFAWGYFEPYHGAVTRSDLNKISNTRPIVLWQRSCHEFIMNDAALAHFSITESNFKKFPKYSDWKAGRVWEVGLFGIAQSVVNYLGTPEQYKKGLELMIPIVHKGGLTTIAEQGFPQVDIALELGLNGTEFNKASTPFRFLMVPNAMYLYPKLQSGSNILAYCDSLVKTNAGKMEYVKAIKFYVDGAIFSQLMVMSKPYEDRHTGAWMMQPVEQEDVFRTFWNANWDIHIHVNGDGGLDTLLAIMERTKASNATSTSKIFLEHYGYARQDQHEKVAKYGLLVSNNPYYYFELSDPYSKQGLGLERASKISSLGSLEKLNVPISFHSDYFMAPAEPLTHVWTAINRLNSKGNVLAPEEKMSLWTAMKAVTIESARSIRKENEIGSIKAGKKADFVLLAQDPFKIDPLTIKDIKILGTVLAGKSFPLP